MIMKQRTLCLISLISLFSVASYVTVHFILDEVNFQRYDNIFVAFIELYLNSHVSLDYFRFTPLFDPLLQMDPSLPYRVSGIAITESYFINFVSLFIMIHYITGIAPQLLVVIPIGVLFVPIIYLNFIRGLLPSNDYNKKITLLLLIYLIIYLAITKYYGSFYVAPPAIALVLILMSCTYGFIQNKHRGPYYLIFCVSLLSLTHYWHSALLLYMCFLCTLFAIANFVFIFQKFWPQFLIFDFHGLSAIKSLIVISCILTLTFIHLWQSTYIVNYTSESSIADFLYKSFIKFTGEDPFLIPYSYSYKESFMGEIHFYSIMSIYFICCLILFICFFISIKSSLNHKRLELNFAQISAISIVLAQILNIAIYYKSSSINFPYVPLFFPIFGVYLFSTIKDNMKNKRLEAFIYVLVSILIIFSIIANISFYLTNEAGITSLTKYRDAEPSLEWVYENSNNSKFIVVDFNILGKYLQWEAKKPKLILNYIDLGPYEYSVLASDIPETPPHLKENYAILDEATMLGGLPIHVTKSRALIKPELKQIHFSSNTNRLYCDGHLSVLLMR